MSKSAIVEKHSKTMSGILDVDNMVIEFEELGRKSLKDLMQKFDGENVRINITVVNEQEN